MIKARRFGPLALLALLFTACGSPPTITGGASPSSLTTPSEAGASPSASPRPQLACSAANRCLVLVTLRGSNQFVVRDITDIAHPKTVSTLQPIPQPRFVSATELSYVDQSNLIRMPLTGSPKTTAAETSDGVGYYAWSPDGSTLAYLTSSGSSMSLHRLKAGQDQVLGTLPLVPAVGCESVANCFGADTWDVQVSYSPDSAYISFVESIASVSVFRIWATSDGKLVKSSDSLSPFMSAWSDSSLYFRDGKGVEVWRSGAVSTFLPGVAWIRPKASPGGGQIVYATRDAQRWSHTFVVDAATGHVRDLGKAHADPVFLTSRYVWYRAERACVAADGCGTRVAGVPSGKAYIYDLQDGTETESIITSVADGWPHAA